MSARTAYEVQGYTDGEWRTLRVCSDEHDAITDAKGLHENRKYLGIRVHAEIFNEATGTFMPRVVYRYSWLTAAPKVPARSNSQPHIARKPTYNRGAYNTRTATQLSESESLGEMLVWRLGIVALIGLSLLLAIQHLI